MKNHENHKKIPGFLLVLIIAFSCLTSVVSAAGGDNTTALNWVKGKQQADGGFSDGFSPSSGAAITADVLVAAAAAGQDSTTWKSAQGKNPIDFLASQANQNLGKTGVLAKITLAAVATGQDVKNFGGIDLQGVLAKQLDNGSGRFNGTIFDQAYAMLAWHALGQPTPQKITDALLSAQNTDGSWAFTGEVKAGSGDSNTTAIAVQALRAAGLAADAPAIQKALTYLRTVQNTDGGFTYQKPNQFGTDSDANSTALVIQALLAANQLPSNWNSPEQFLVSLQYPNGAYAFQVKIPGDNLLATVQAIPTLAKVTLTDLRVVHGAVLAVENSPAVQSVPAPQTLPVTGSAASADWLALLGLAALSLGLCLRVRRI